MYQTAGHALLPLYQDALSIPLYRSPITGTAISKEKDYAGPPGQDAGGGSDEATKDTADETEDLIPLLHRVMSEHPKANALSCGAILSTYQRTRVESVCSRLGLVPLAYLWQYPILPSPNGSPTTLLEDGANVGLDSRIVKVASGGLDESFLWGSLADRRFRGKVEKAVAKFGGSALGEGGEFETLVIEGPKGLWRGRTEVKDEEREVRTGEGGEAWLEFGRGKVVGFDGGDVDESQWRWRLRIPPLLDPIFETLSGEPLPPRPLSNNFAHKPWVRSWEPSSYAQDHGYISSIFNLTSFGSDQTIEVQMKSLAERFQAALEEADASACNIVFVTILLRSMSDFPAINAVYGQLFSNPNPPARVTVACGSLMPKGKHVMLSALVCKKLRGEKRGLHVQSRSYWAPANIGPYSQAISIVAGSEAGEEASRLVYIAGQIPLVPSSMAVRESHGDEKQGLRFRDQALLALQHLWRIGVEMNVTWWTGGVAFLAGKGVTGPDVVASRAQIAWYLWKSVHKLPLDEDNDDNGREEDTGLDAWDLKYGGMGTFAIAETQRRPLPDFERVRHRTTGMGSQASNPSEAQHLIPGFLVVEVAELPRACDIEWHAAGYSGNEVVLFEDSHKHSQEASLWSKTESILSVKATDYGVSSDIVEVLGRDAAAFNEPARLSKNFEALASVRFISVPMQAFSLLGNYDDQSSEEYVVEGIQSTIRAFLYNRSKQSTTAPAATVYTSYPAVFVNLPVQIIPCSRVWGVQEENIQEIGAGLVIHSSYQSELA